MLKSWGGVLALFVIAFVCWYVGVLVAPSFFFVIFEIAAVIASVLCLCFFVIAVVRQFRPDASSYRIFAWTEPCGNNSTRQRPPPFLSYIS